MRATARTLMRRVWPDFDFAAYALSKRERRSIVNPGLREWQAFLCPLEEYRQGAGSLRDRGRALSVHHPFIAPWRGLGRPGSGLFMRPDASERENSFAWLEDTLERGAGEGARFAVTHLADAGGRLEPGEARRMAESALSRMAEAADRFGIELHVEFMGYHRTFNSPEQFRSAIDRFPRLRICLDTGHIHRWAQIGGGDDLAGADLLAPVTASMHLWNVNSAEEYAQKGHVPVHPSQTPERGYADVERMLGTVLSANRDVSIIFEPSIRDSTSEDFVAEGVLWVKSLVDAAT